MKKALMILFCFLFFAGCNDPTSLEDTKGDITWGDKSVGSSFTSSDANEIKSAVNSKMEEEDIDTLSELNAIVTDATFVDNSSIASSASIGITAGDSYANFSGSADDDTINELFAAINTNWASGVDNYTVKVDAAATADYLYDAGSGAVRAGTNVTIDDNGDYITINASLAGGAVDTDGAINADEIAIFYDADTIKALTEAEFKTAYNMEAGTDYQGYDADLTTYASITPSADVQAILGSTNYASIAILQESANEGVIDIQDLQGNIADSQVPNDITIDVANLATTLTIADNENTNETNAILFTAGGELTGGNLSIESDGDLNYNPSTGTLSAMAFNGSGASITAVDAATLDSLDSTDFESATSNDFDPDRLAGDTDDDNLIQASLIDIAGQTAETTIAVNDLILIYDVTATANRAMTRSNFVTGIGAGQAITFDIGDDGGDDSTDVGEIATSGDTNSIFTEPSADKILIDVSQNWPTADTANAGDSATAFFSTGTIEYERGGLEADVSAYDGLVRISSGTSSAVSITSAGEAILDDVSASAQRTTLGLVIGTDVLAPNGDGSSLTGVVAASGDSATAFFSAGTIEDARIASTIARDSEVSAAYEAIDAEILRADSADTISADFEWQDNYPISFGNDNDAEIDWDTSLTDNDSDFTTALTGEGLVFTFNNAAADEKVVFDNGDATYGVDLYVKDIIYSGTLSYDGVANNSRLPLSNNTSITGSGYEIFFEGGNLISVENGDEKELVNVEDDATFSGTSYSFSGATNLTVPTAADASGEIAIDITAHQLQWHDGNKALTIDSDADAAGYVLKSDGAGNITFQADATGGTPSWDTVNNPAADASLTHDAGEETSFLYTGNFTTGSQFLVEQLTGNPSGGVLFEAKGADSSIDVFKAGDGTNAWTISAAGEFANTGTATINFAAATDILIASNQIDAQDLADVDAGDVSWSGGSVTLDADVVAAAEMADADHGDISWSSGVASIDADAVTLATDTTGNYVAAVTDAGSGAIDISGSGSENASVALALDLTPSSGSATLIEEEDALQVKYVATDFNEGASGLAIDYANGQAATTGQDGFMQSAQVTALETVDSEDEIEAMIFDSDAETVTAIWTLNRQKYTVHTAEPTDEAVGDILVADGDTWNPASRSGTNDYMVVCTAAGSPGTWLAMRDMVTGELLFSAFSGSTPQIIFKDDDATADDDNVYWTINCTDVGDGTEDCDATLYAQVAGSATAVITIDADGSGTAGFVLRDDSIGPAEMASGAYDLGTSLEADTLTENGNAVWNDADTDIVDDTHVNWASMTYLGEEGQPTAAAVGLASANLDDTDASIEWEDAAALDSDGSVSANAIDSEHYTNGSIDTAHIAADQITSALIADDQIDSEHYVAASIDNEHLADDAVDSDEIADGAVDAAHLAADVIDETKIADDGIDSEHYNDGSIDPVHLANVVKSQFIPIGWFNDGTSAPGDLTEEDNSDYRDFASDGTEDVECDWLIPGNLTGSTVKVRAIAIVTNATTPADTEGVSWEIAACSNGTNDGHDCTLGTAVYSEDTDLDDDAGAQWDLIFFPYVEVTPTGLAAGEMLKLSVARDHDNTDDDYGQDIGLIGVEIKWQEDPGTMTY